VNLPTNSTDRLLAVADIIELEPERYNQGDWWDDGINDDDRSPLMPWHIAGQGHACNTTACIAGWGVALCDESLPINMANPWEIAGAWALGLHMGLATALFDYGTADRLGSNAEVADVLRRLAKIPEGERHYAEALKVLTDEQAVAVFNFFDEDCEVDA
jgi:hypothetical protein